MIGEPGRTVLLDTCTVLDLAIAPSRIAAAAMAELGDPSTSLLVSAVSAWEISIKTRRGRLPGGERLLNSWRRSLLDLRADSLGIDHDDAIRAGGLPWAHPDPFDRMLVAQAARLNVALATRDAVIIAAGVVRVVDTRA